jgi:hypothetical protein
MQPAAIGGAERTSRVGAEGGALASRQQARIEVTGRVPNLFAATTEELERRDQGGGGAHTMVVDGATESREPHPSHHMEIHHFGFIHAAAAYKAQFEGIINSSMLEALSKNLAPPKY